MCKVTKDTILSHSCFTDCTLLRVEKKLEDNTVTVGSLAKGNHLINPDRNVASQVGREKQVQTKQFALNKMQSAFREKHLLVVA